MADMVSVKEAVKRARADGMPISEYCLRRWIKTGEVPVRFVGRKALVYYPTLMAFMRCENGGDNPKPVMKENTGKIRLLGVG